MANVRPFVSMVCWPLVPQLLSAKLGKNLDVGQGAEDAAEDWCALMCSPLSRFAVPNLANTHPKDV